MSTGFLVYKIDFKYGEFTEAINGIFNLRLKSEF